MSSRRGDIALSWVLSVLFAIILFGAVIGVGSKVFRLSDQASTSFSDFHDELVQFEADAIVGEREIVTLILDDKTTLGYFTSPLLVVEVDAQGVGLLDYSISLARPSKCTSDSCLCLFRDLDKRSSIFEQEVTLLYEEDDTGSVFCRDLDFALTTRENCGFGVAQSVAGYSCTDGFFIERDVLESLNIRAVYENNRRTELLFEKFDNSVGVFDVE